MGVVLAGGPGTRRRSWNSQTQTTLAAFDRLCLTVAERPLDPAAYPGADPRLLSPGSSVFFMPTRPAKPGDIRSRWVYVSGAYWRNPEGPEQHDRRSRAAPGRTPGV
jgi:hypothetical protein